jgi:glycosyltransferase involved in cell wall biosynthesis
MAILLPDLRPGGAQTVMVRVANGLVARGHSISLIVLDGVGELGVNLDPRINTIDLLCKRSRFAFVPILRALREERPSAVISTSARLNILLILMKPFLRSNIVTREATTLSTIEGYERILYRALCRYTDRMVCLSNAMIEDVRQNLNVPQSKLVRIYNPVPSREIISQLKEADNPFADDEIPVVICGRLSYPKGVDIMLEAMARIGRDNPTVRLHVVGDGELAEELRALANRLGIADRVVFHGYVHDRFKFLRFARLVVSSSRWEGLPNVVLEAIAVGTPVVATNCPGGTGEIVKPGLNGWLVAPESPEEIARVVTRCIREDERLDPGRVAGSLSDYDEDRTLDAYEALLCDA